MYGGGREGKRETEREREREGRRRVSINAMRRLVNFYVASTC
jgi:hypothetical protein